MISTLGSLLIPTVSGILAVTLISRETHFKPHRPVLIFLGLGFGLGMSSTLFILSTAVFPSLASGYFILEALMVSLLTTVYLIRRRYKPVGPSTPGSGGLSEPLWLSVAVGLVFLVLCYYAGRSFVLLLSANPHGQWDAWVIWNTRARFIFRGGELWLSTFADSPGNPHPDYPLLLPGLVARTWTTLNTQRQIVPAIIATAFAAGTIGLLSAAIHRLRGPSQAILAASVLTITPTFIFWASSQEADVPLSFLYLAATVLLFLHDRSYGERTRYLTLAGLFVGLAIWTKNDGWSLFFAVLIVRNLPKRWGQTGRVSFSENRSYYLGLLPGLLITLAFKIWLAPENDILAGQSLSATLARLTDVSRYLQVLQAGISEIAAFGGWIIPANLILLIYLFLLRSAIPINERRASINGALTISLILTVYFFVYMISPHPLAWHLATSLERLILHVWPSLLFLFFLTVQTLPVALGFPPAIVSSPRVGSK